jgi:hypothetical protein
MMNTRTAVLILQGLGSITLFAYPSVFLAGIMSFAASDDASGPVGMEGVAGRTCAIGTSNRSHERRRQGARCSWHKRVIHHRLCCCST